MDVVHLKEEEFNLILISKDYKIIEGFRPEFMIHLSKNLQNGKI
jgi:hypothetical protein